MSEEKDYKKLYVSKSTVVAQGNFLIEAKPDMSTHELKLFSTLVASISYDQTEFNDLEVSIRNVISLWEADPKNAYTYVRNALYGLSKKQFQLERTNPDGTRTVEGSSYISSYRFTEGSSVAYISISPVFAPYLLALKANYTTYMLRNVLKLSLSHSIRTYELLAQYKRIGVRKFNVDDYKKKVGIENKYKGNNANLKARVLDPVCKEISEKTDIITRYTVTGRGSNAVIEFLIFPKETIPGTNGKTEVRIENGDFDLLMDLLTTAIHMTADFTEEEIEKIAEHAFQITPADADVSTAFILCSQAYHDFGIASAARDVHNPLMYFIKILDSKAEEGVEALSAKRKSSRTRPNQNRE